LANTCKTKPTLSLISTTE